MKLKIEIDAPEIQTSFTSLAKVDIYLLGELRQKTSEIEDWILRESKAEFIDEYRSY